MPCRRGRCGSELFQRFAASPRDRGCNVRQMSGLIAPRHAQTVHDVLSRGHEALHAGKARRLGSVEIFRPNVERDALRRENMRASDEIIGALNERRILAAFEPVVDAVSRRPAFHERECV